MAWTGTHALSIKINNFPEDFIARVISFVYTIFFYDAPFGRNSAGQTGRRISALCIHITFEMLFSCAIGCFSTQWIPNEKTSVT
jgi:hypothetical protein